MDKEDVCVYTHTHTHMRVHAMEYYSATKNENLSFATTWMYLDVMLSEIGQIDKKYNITSMWNLKNSESNKKETDLQIQKTN